MQEVAVVQSERGSTPQAGVIIGTLVAVALLVAGLWVGLAERTPIMCGSVLGGSARDLTSSGAILCDRTLSAPTMWTWTLIGAAILSFVVGLIITVIMKGQERASAGRTA